MGFMAWLRQQSERADAVGYISRFVQLPSNTHIKTLRRLRFEFALKGNDQHRAALESAITEWRRQ